MRYRYGLLVLIILVVIASVGCPKGDRIPEEPVQESVPTIIDWYGLLNPKGSGNWNGQ